MSIAQLDPILRHIRTLVADRDLQECSDRQLLDEFTSRGQEGAFAALVARHGPMVLRVCRRVLGHEQDAEDSFQATFLVLARNIKSIRKREALASWLHGVAYRTAMKAKRNAARRRTREECPRPAPSNASGSLTWGEVQAALDEELRKLPEPFRSAFVLCVLDGKTGPEAAAVLGCKEGTVSSRLTRARQRLQRQLTRRGINLGALLGALAVAEGACKAAVTSALIHSTIRYGLLASGVTAGGHIPPHLVALAHGVTGAMSLTKVKVAAVVLLAACLVTGTGTVAYQAFAATGTDGTPQEITHPTKATQARGPAEDAKIPQRDSTEDKDAVTYSGRVLGPDGKPVAGAKVFYYFVTHADEPTPVRATTDGEGSFSFTLTRNDVPLSADTPRSGPLRSGRVVVEADGFTLAWASAKKQTSDLSLQLSRDDSPVEGRIVDLEGKPLAGLRVSAVSAAAAETGDLSLFVKALQSKEALYSASFTHLPNYLGNPITGHTLAGSLPVTTTDADGRFRLRGFAPERLVELRIEGKAIETQNLFVLTRAKPTGSAQVLTSLRLNDPLIGPEPHALIFWNGFDHAVAPGQTVVGTVRDKSTGRPIPRAIVESYMLAGTNLAQNTIYSTVADDEGYYEFTGLPRGKGNRIRIRPPRDQAYIPVVKDVPPMETFAKATVEVSLVLGVWVDVTATDKGTGKPVPGLISYFVLPEKWDARSRFRNPYSDAYNNFMPIRNDGTFRFVAVPGRAVVAFRADWDKYPIAREAPTMQLPSSLSPSNFQAFAEINPKLGDGKVKAAFTLDSERVVKGTILGPDGRPLTGVLATALRHDWYTAAQVLSTAEFTALGVDPARPRLLCFAHADKKLAGSTVVRGDEKEPVIVKLQPSATVSGRLLDADGKPTKSAAFTFIAVPIAKPDQPRPIDTGLHVVDRSAYKPSPDPKTDGEGRFRVEGLIPGLKYNLALADARGAVDITAGLVFSNLVLEPGETKDLGDVRLQPFPKE